jgi:hypothetical protein
MLLQNLTPKEPGAHRVVGGALFTLRVDDPQLIIHRLRQILPHPKILLAGLDRGVTQQHLNLLQITSRVGCRVTESSAIDCTGLYRVGSHNS